MFMKNNKSTYQTNYEKKIRNDDYRTCGNDCLL